MGRSGVQQRHTGRCLDVVRLLALLMKRSVRAVLITKPHSTCMLKALLVLVKHSRSGSSCFGLPRRPRLSIADTFNITNAAAQWTLPKGRTCGRRPRSE